MTVGKRPQRRYVWRPRTQAMPQTQGKFPKVQALFCFSRMKNALIFL